MHLPPTLESAYQHAVAAGMEILLAQETQDEIMQALQLPGDVTDKLAQGIAGLMLVLFDQTNKTMPPQVIIPAGIELLVHAAEFLDKSGTEVSDKEVAAATASMIQILLKKFGVDPQKMMGAMDAMGQLGKLPVQAPDAAPAVPPSTEPAPAAPAVQAHAESAALEGVQ